MMQTIRELVTSHARLPVPVEDIADDDDLYVAGLTSFAAVQLMLAVEDAFDVEFPEALLNRRTFSSIKTMAACVQELVPVSV